MNDTMCVLSQWMWEVSTHIEQTQTKCNLVVDHAVLPTFLLALGVVAKWSKVHIPVPWPLMVWSTLALGT